MIISIGQLVRLRSGGPLMTTYRQDEDDLSTIYCHWFDCGSLMSNSFHINTLVDEDGELLCESTEQPEQNEPHDSEIIQNKTQK